MEIKSSGSKLSKKKNTKEVHERVYIRPLISDVELTREGLYY